MVQFSHFLALRTRKTWQDVASGKKYADNWEAKMATGRLSRQPRACADLLQRLRSAEKKEMSLRTCEGESFHKLHVLSIS